MRQLALTSRAESIALAAFADELDALAAKGLTIDRDRVIVRHGMQATAPSLKPRRQVGRPSEVKHPWRTYLDSIGWTVADWCAVNGEGESTAKSWMRTGPTGRKIPEARAFQIRDEAGKDDAGRWRVPADATTWPHGIK